MPNYEYQCTTCNHKFELWQSVGEAAPACTECGKGVKKIFHVPRVIFKGSGFYVTDMRAEKEGKSKSSDKNSGEAKTSETSSSADSSSSSESKSESKTEAAPATSGASSTSSAASSGSEGK